MSIYELCQWGMSSCFLRAPIMGFGPLQPTAGTLWMASGTVTTTAQWNRFLKMRSLPEGLTFYFIRNGTASLHGQPAAPWEVGAAAHYRMRRNWDVTVRTGKMLSQTSSTRRGSCGCSCRDLNTRGRNPIFEAVEWSYWNPRKGIHSPWLLVVWDPYSWSHSCQARF